MSELRQILSARQASVASRYLPVATTPTAGVIKDFGQCSRAFLMQLYGSLVGLLHTSVAGELSETQAKHANMTSSGNPQPEHQ